MHRNTFSSTESLVENYCITNSFSVAKITLLKIKPLCLKVLIKLLR